ncbi:MAG TPA: hypothetical protein DEQ24_05080 [Enterococcus sp.]|nr:hypothetical protein [Enterococcus sp.]
MLFHLIIYSHFCFILSSYLMLDTKIKKNKQLLSCIFILTVLCCFIETHISFIGLFIFMIGLLLSNYFSDSVSTSMILLAKLLVSYYICYFLMRIASPFISFVTISENNRFSILYLIIGIFFNGFLGYIIHPYLEDTLHKYNFLEKFIYFIACIWFFNNCYQIFMYLYFYPQNFQTQSLFMVLAVFFVFVLIIMILIIYSLESKKKVQQAQQQTQTAYEEIKIYSHALEISYQDLRAFRHDYNNILLSIQEFIDEDNLTGLTNYYHNHLKITQEQVTTSFTRLDDIQNIGLSEIRSIIMHKLNKAQSLGIAVSLEVHEELLEKAKIDTVQLVRLIGILLDNAIEAAQESNTPSLSVAAFRQEDDVLVIIENTYSASLSKEYLLKLNNLSTKGPERGIGLQNAAAIVKQENRLFLETRISDEHYTQTITIQQEE